MAIRYDRSDVKQTTTGFRGPLMVQSLTSAKSKFLSLDLKNLCEYVKIDLKCELTPQLDDAFAQRWSDAVVRSSEEITPCVLCRQDSFNWVALFRALDKGESPTT